jgi:hypothetical protein
LAGERLRPKDALRVDQDTSRIVTAAYDGRIVSTATLLATLLIAQLAALLVALLVALLAALLAALLVAKSTTTLLATATKLLTVDCPVSGQAGSGKKQHGKRTTESPNEAAGRGTHGFTRGGIPESDRRTGRRVVAREPSGNARFH